jgi:uncharacterized protein (TIGR00255 family)
VIASMTGFSRARGDQADESWIWELKSVNARGLDIRVRLPSGHEDVETAIRDAIAKRFRRGSFFASLTLQRPEGEAQLQVNRDLLDQLLSVCRELGGETPRVEALLNVRGVLTPAEKTLDEAAESARRGAYIKSFEEVLEELEAARREEGARLHAVLETRLGEIEDLVSEAEAGAEARPEAVRARLASQLAELLENTQSLSEDRLAQELAIVAVKNDIREEIDRLGAHVAQGRDLLAEEAPVGRRLDFLCQEFNREANTLCAKSNDVRLTRIGMALKAIIDQLREQVQNVE